MQAGMQLKHGMRRLASGLAASAAQTKQHPRTLALQCHAVIQRPSEVVQPTSQWLGQKALEIFTGPAAPPPPTAAQPEVLKALEARLGPGVGSSHDEMVPPAKPVVVIISGPSGVGKDTVVARLKELREDLYFVVTATSRPKRSSEVEGRDYFFVTKERFEQWIKTDMLLEHALVYGEYKGIPRQQVDDALRAGTDVVLRIDVQGAATVKRLMPEAITIFVAAESEACLVSRLAARNTEDVDRLATRVATARAEVARIHEFDYVVVNRTGKLEECVAQVAGIIDAEKSRTSNRLRSRASSSSSSSSSS